MRFLGALLIIIGILGIAAGIVYFVEPAHSLPTWFPGHLATSKTLHHDKRGIIGVAVGAVLLLIGGLLARPRAGGRRAYRY
jgi:integral membrane sensor domain MASE1